MPAPAALPYSGPSATTESQIPNPPKVNDQGENSQAAIKDAGQALNIAKSTEWGARAVIRRAAAVYRVKNNAPPFSPTALRQGGSAWQSNVSTGVMSSLCQQVASRLYQRLKNVKYLTAVCLPDNVPGFDDKTAFYRQTFTETVRAWTGWNTFLMGLADELVTVGFCFPTFADRWDWRPKVYRVDEGFVPQGCPILDQGMQYYIIRHDWDVYDLLEKLKKHESPEAAEEAGWDILNCVASINAAHPKPRPLTGLAIDTIRFEDMIREIIPASSYSKGSNVVETYRVWARETNGYVSEWMVDSKSSQLLFKDTRPMVKMEDLVLPMAFQYGNGHVYGSKGVGVQLFERIMMVEKARNRATDLLNFAGKMAVQCKDAAEASKVKLDVFAAFMTITGATPIQGGTIFPDRSEAFLKEDKYWMDMMMQDVGIWLPAVTSTEKTATQSRIDSLSQNEANSTVMDTILTEFQILSGMIARRLCNPFSPTQEAKDFMGKLTQGGLSPQDIATLAGQSPTMNRIDFDEEIEKGKAAFLQTLRGNANWDQAKIERYLGDTVLGPELTANFLLPTPDQNMTAENTTKQLLENPQLTAGVPMPVAPKDNHAVHMLNMQGQQNPQTGQWSGPISQAIQRGNMPGANMLMAHYATHLQTGQNEKSLGALENGQKAFLGAMQKMYAKAQQQAQQHQVQQAAAAGLGAGPAMLPGGTIQPPAQGM